MVKIKSDGKYHEEERPRTTKKPHVQYAIHSFCYWHSWTLGGEKKSASSKEMYQAALWKALYSLLRHFRINHWTSLDEVKAYNENTKSLNYRGPIVLVSHHSYKGSMRNPWEHNTAKVSTRSFLRTLQLAGGISLSLPPTLASIPALI